MGRMLWRQHVCFGFIFYLLGFQLHVFASEKPEMAPEGAGWLWDLLSNSDMEAVIAAVVTLVAGYVARWAWVRKWRLEKAVECLAIGVRETYTEYVRGIKMGREDGTLTADERDAAMNMALEKAKALAISAGFDLVKVYAEEYLPVLAEKILREQKAG